MNSLELRLLQLVQLAESPVYSAYRWLTREVGHEFPISEFLRLLGPLIDQDIIRFWAIDAKTQERSRWDAVPPNLEQRYAEVADLDESFDPLGLSLTLGPAADVEANPEWKVDFDFDQRRFLMTATPDSVGDAWQRISGLFPDLAFEEVDRKIVKGGVRIEGAISENLPRHDGEA